MKLSQSVFMMLGLFLLIFCSVNVSATDKLDLSCNSEYTYTARPGDTISQTIYLYPQENYHNVEVIAGIYGYEYDDLIKKTHVFDMGAGNEYSKTFNFKVPEDLEPGYYKLRFTILDNDDLYSTCEVNYKIEWKRHSLSLKDVSFSPGTELEAGSSLITNLMIENQGHKSQESVKVKVSIPELGISYTKYVDVKAKGSEIVRDLQLSIPEYAKDDDYNLKIMLTHQEGHKKLEKTFPIKVKGKDSTKENVKVMKIILEQENIQPVTQNDDNLSFFSKLLRFFTKWR